jgi:succinoglycan biosynthesis transport protein ExoP
MDQKQKEVHLLDYLHLLRKRKWLIFTSLFITVTTVVIGNYTVTPIYEAQSQLVIDKDSGKSIVSGQSLEYLDYESYLSESLTFNTQFKMVVSYPVLVQAVKNLHLKERYEKQKNSQTNGAASSPLKAAILDNIKKFHESVKSIIPFINKEKHSQDKPSLLSSEQKEYSETLALVNSLKLNISSEQIPETRLVTITVKDEDPVWAQKIANGVVDAYIEYDIRTRGSAAQKFIDWILSQINGIKQKLNEAEKAFYQFKSANKIFSLSGKQGINTQKIGDLNASYIKVRTEHMELRARLAELEKIMARRNEKTLSSNLLGDQVLQGLSKELTDAQIQLSDLKMRYKGKHPKVLDLTGRVDILQGEFNSKLNKVYKNFMIEDSVLQSREDDLQNAIKKYEEDALLTNQSELRYAVLEREVETNKGLYEIMMNKLKETQINESTGKSNVRLIEPADLPQYPISPKKFLNIILAAIVGLISGVGLTFLMEYMETNIKTEEDVEQYLHLPVLGIIPEVERTGKSS